MPSRTRPLRMTTSYSGCCARAEPVSARSAAIRSCFMRSKVARDGKSFQNGKSDVDLERSDRASLQEQGIPPMTAIRRLRRAAGTAVLAPAAVSLLAGTAPARAEPAVLEEVVVTATKRAEPILNIPVAVSALTSSDIQTRGFTQYSDYLNTLPGVFFQDSGPGTSTIRIRGISASEGGVPSTTASYFGESVTSVLTNHGGKPNLKLVDIDRVEVIRGPQGTLFGANALAGVVRTIPMAPNVEQFEAELGTRGFTTAHSGDESYHVEGVVNIPLVHD